MNHDCIGGATGTEWLAGYEYDLVVDIGPFPVDHQIVYYLFATTIQIYECFSCCFRHRNTVKDKHMYKFQRVLT